MRQDLGQLLHYADSGASTSQGDFLRAAAGAACRHARVVVVPFRMVADRGAACQMSNRKAECSLVLDGEGVFD